MDIDLNELPDSKPNIFTPFKTSEFNQALNSIQNMFNNLTLTQPPLQQPPKEEEVKKATLNNF
jgi:hypothetical protein